MRPSKSTSQHLYLQQEQLPCEYWELLIGSSNQILQSRELLKEYCEKQPFKILDEQVAKTRNVNFSEEILYSDVLERSAYKRFLRQGEDSRDAEQVKVIESLNSEHKKKLLICFKHGTKLTRQISIHDNWQEILKYKNSTIIDLYLNHALNLIKRYNLDSLVRVLQGGHKAKDDHNEKDINDAIIDLLVKAESSKKLLEQVVADIRNYSPSTSTLSAMQLYERLKQGCYNLVIITRGTDFKDSNHSSSSPVINIASFKNQLFGEICAERLRDSQHPRKDEKSRFLGCAIRYETDSSHPKKIKIERFDYEENQLSPTPNVVYIKIKKYDQSGNLKTGRNHRDLEFSNPIDNIIKKQYCFIKVTFDSLGEPTIDNEHIYTSSFGSSGQKQKVKLEDLAQQTKAELVGDISNIELDVANYQIQKDMNLKKNNNNFKLSTLFSRSILDDHSVVGSDIESDEDITLARSPSPRSPSSRSPSPRSLSLRLKPQRLREVFRDSHGNRYSYV